jgi:hypothetical protein
VGLLQCRSMCGIRKGTIEWLAPARACVGHCNVVHELLLLVLARAGLQPSYDGQAHRWCGMLTWQQGFGGWQVKQSLEGHRG